MPAAVERSEIKYKRHNYWKSYERKLLCSFICNNYYINKSFEAAVEDLRFISLRIQHFAKKVKKKTFFSKQSYKGNNDS